MVILLIKILITQRNGIISIIRSIPDEQDTEVTYYLGQELGSNKMTFEEYEEQVNKVNREEIISFASKVNIDTIYFLKN